MDYNPKKWQILTVSVFSILVILILIMRLLFGYSVDFIVMIDLALGIFALVLAMYVYNKEKMLEKSIISINQVKEQEAFVSILTNIMIFENILDNIFVDDYIQGKQQMKIGDSTHLYTHHNNLRLVFFAHADILEKTIMGRLAQHVSMLEAYVKDDQINIVNHIDNMHDMDDLIDYLTEKIDNPQMIHFMRDIFMKKRRHNRFMLFTLDEMQRYIQKYKESSDHIKMLRVMVLLTYDFEYNLNKTPSDIVKKSMIKISDIDDMLLDENNKHNHYQKITDFLSELSDQIKEDDHKMGDVRLKWVDHLQDYARIINPLIFLVNMIDNAQNDSMWISSLKVRCKLILHEVNKRKHLSINTKTHITDTLDEMLAGSISKNNCLVKLRDLKKHLDAEVKVIQAQRDEI